MSTVLWTASAADDLMEIIDHILVDSVIAAGKLIHRIESAVAELSDYPEIGRIVPKLLKHNIDRYREVVLAPWRLIYRIEDHRIYFLAFIDGRRNIEDILLRRLLRRRE